MKPTAVLIVFGAVLLGACGQPEQASMPNSAALASQTTTAAQANLPPPTLPALLPNPASRLQTTEPALQSAIDTFRIYDLGGLAASSIRPKEQYQQDATSAVIRNLAARLNIDETAVRVVSVQDTDVASCGGKTDSIAAERSPGLEVIAQADGTTYHYTASGGLGYYCGET